MKAKDYLFVLSFLFAFSCSKRQSSDPIIIDETNQVESVEQTIVIDSVWSGHPVEFSLYTHKDRQYVAYFNADRHMVVGQKRLNDDSFELNVFEPTSREISNGTSTVLEWDSHNFLTLGVDKDGYIHLSGNVHNNPLTYFRSIAPNDISNFEQIFEMVGTNEQRTTYPHFIHTKEGEMLYHYRDGGSGNGNEIYNIYDTETKTWSRLLDTPLTDGQGEMNAYQSEPKMMDDGWYHMYWVWRDTPDCSTNHDLSYMKSPDLKNWYNAFGEPLTLPATLDKEMLIVDPIPVKGGIINLAAELALDKKNDPVFTYHKYDSVGNLQLYTAQIQNRKWVYKQVTNWDYRWEFSGWGSIKFEVLINGFSKRPDGNYEIDYYHIKYGNGTILLNNQFEAIGKVLKPETGGLDLKVEGNFPGLEIHTALDEGKSPDANYRYMLKWETLERNRDMPRDKPWPEASQLMLYKIKRPD